MILLENPDLSDPEARRASLDRLKRLLLIAFGGFAIFSLRNLFLGYPISSGINALGAVSMLLCLALAVSTRRSGGLILSVHAALLCATITLGVVGIFTGQSLAVTGWFAASLPLFACFQLGIRGALTWTLVSLAMVFGVHLTGVIHPVTPEFVPRKWELFSGQVVLMTVVVAFGISFRQIGERYVHRLRHQAEELEVSRDEALSAARTKAQFVATMSHEIRTPLAGIMGMTELLAQTSLNAEQREMVEAVLKSSQLLRSVVDDILDFSKLEARSVSLEQVAFSPEDALDDVLELFALAAREKDLELAVVLAPDLPHAVAGDPLRFRQIASNLISNAVKFTDAGSVVARLEPAEEGFRLSVRDTGPGIAPDQLGNLFQPFEQLDSSTTRRYGGTGLGLAISQRLAGLMGRQIVVESQPGRGSEFSLVFPWKSFATDTAAPPFQGRTAGVVGLRPVEREGVVSRLTRLGLTVGEERPDVWLVGPGAVAPGSPSLQLRWPGHKEEPGHAASLWLPLRRSVLEQALLSLFEPLVGRDGRPETVLIVEDTLINQKVLTRMLSRLGYEAHVVEDGAQALDSLRERHYPMVLMDIHMPVMDGVEATRRIRAELPAERQPFICAVSASSHQEQREEMFQAGANAFIGKPVALSELRAVFSRWADGASTVE